MEILDSHQMSLADRLTIEELKIPSIVLMENAARASADVIEKVVGGKRCSFAVIVGAGNNGGDGIAIARHLYNKGFHLEIFLAESEEKFSQDLLINYEIIKRYPIKLNRMEDYEDKFDYIIDALFGTGLNRSLEGKYLEIVRKINYSKAKIFSVDIPSGLSGSFPNMLGEAVKANWTITFCRPKIPHCIYPAKDYCGEVLVVDISIPDFIIPKVEPYLYQLNKETVPSIPKRLKFTHKGAYGHAVLLGGSLGKSGAITIATIATIRTGAGLTTSIIPEKIFSSFAASIPEAMYFTVEDFDYISYEEIDKVVEFVKDKTVLTIGPGMGTSGRKKELINELIDRTDIPVILDADGINNLSISDLNKLKFRSVITPHLGEFSRLIGVSKDELQKDIIKMAREFSVKYGIILVLKSASTLVALPDGVIYVYSGGIPALAKGGSGDCLVGIITGFVSQGFSLRDSALLGVYIFGETGRKLSSIRNELTITATDLIKNIDGIIDELQHIIH